MYLKNPMSTETFALRDRPALERELTPQMVTAGVRALECYSESYDSWALVEVIYRAMVEAGAADSDRQVA